MDYSRFNLTPWVGAICVYDKPNSAVAYFNGTVAAEGEEIAAVGSGIWVSFI